jgi:diguanylate cyclase (GGDEF)-like protein/PAS domain S-box-containing protein
MRSSFKVWLLLGVGAFYIFFQYLLIYHFGDLYFKEKDSFQKSVLAKHSDDLEKSLNIKEKDSFLLMVEISQKIDLQEILKRRDAKNILSKKFGDFDFKGRRLTIFSVERQPLFSSDNLGIDSEEAISRFLDNGKYLSIFSSGVVSNSLRFIFPIFDNDKLLGGLEISYSEKEILDLLRKSNSNNLDFYQILVDSSSIDLSKSGEKDSYQSSPLSKGYLSSKESLFLIKENHEKMFQILSNVDRTLFSKNLRDGTKKVSVLSFKGDRSLVSIIPLFEVGDEKRSFFVAYRFDEVFVELQKRHVLNLILTSLTLIVAIILFLFREFMKVEVDHEKKYIDLLFNTQKDIVVVTDGERISNGNEALFKFLEIEDITHFRLKYRCISEVFKVVKKPNYIYRDKNGRVWLNDILQHRGINYRAIIEKDGREYTFLVNATRIDFEKSKKSLVTLTNITELVEYQNDLQNMVAEKVREIDENLEIMDRNIIMSSTDKNGIITDVSTAYLEKTGYSREDLIGKKHSVMRHPDADLSIYEDLWKTVSSGGVWYGQMLNRDFYGRDYWLNVSIHPKFNSEREITGYIAIRQDISDRKLIEKLEATDQLTSLKNRKEFSFRFASEFEEALKEEKPFSLMILEIDNIKKYNNIYGYKKGDSLIRSISIIFRNCSNIDSEHLFRLGGGEFCAIFPFKSEEEALETAEKIKSNVENSGFIHSDNGKYKVATVSIGIFFSIGILEGEKKEDIYSLAYTTLQKAQNKGGNRVEIIVDSMD